MSATSATPAASATAAENSASAAVVTTKSPARATPNGALSTGATQFGVGALRQAQQLLRKSSKPDRRDQRGLAGGAPQRRNTQRLEATPQLAATATPNTPATASR